MPKKALKIFTASAVAVSVVTPVASASTTSFLSKNRFLCRAFKCKTIFKG